MPFMRIYEKSMEDIKSKTDKFCAEAIKDVHDAIDTISQGSDALKDMLKKLGTKEDTHGS